MLLFSEINSLAVLTTK